MQRAFYRFSNRNDILRHLHTDAYNYFRSILGDSGVLTAPDIVSSVNQDWTGNFTGNATTVLAPASTAEVSDVLAYCHDERVAIVPMGGNTGLTGGAVPSRGEVVLSFSRMNQILGFQEVCTAVRQTYHSMCSHILSGCTRRHLKVARQYVPCRDVLLSTQSCLSLYAAI